MAKPLLYGAHYSVYVRIARMALNQKGVDYELVPLDIFTAERASIIGYFLKVAEGRKLLARFPDLQDRWDRIVRRASFSNA
ncbi:MAG: hypothetical protein EOQ55_08520 [Mesorhizobium sp.]|nr:MULTISPECIES: glutathione S-transferase N-terminal domain-containing protein [unclassified Mesorhizobium]WIE89297.1 glutathione S-transferase N-terminal domain-containing protein [Mesorhizobium sp. WSM4875]MDG4852103.1 glutathione S-transferase N-terminal domain-containing protein [Mesorhizobium sp. WSM4982]MDG4885988.1 glutathione S-transferase N-terminal domain-containing protein [Mesorhizobium sp. WSM4887]MDG4902501.1 glutathione S-transferase N-terminal domain-containing protein [Mesorhi